MNEPQVIKRKPVKSKKFPEFKWRKREWLTSAENADSYYHANIHMYESGWNGELEVEASIKIADCFRSIGIEFCGDDANEKIDKLVNALWVIKRHLTAQRIAFEKHRAQHPFVKEED